MHIPVTNHRNSGCWVSAKSLATGIVSGYLMVMTAPPILATLLLVWLLGKGIEWIASYPYHYYRRND
jgi:hypothetical protein